jgi:L-lactate dehydrogenase complex protein LldG
VNARQEVLARIRRALDGAQPAPAVARGYRQAGGGPKAAPGELLDLLEDRLIDYRATVRRAAPSEVAGTVALRLAAHGAHRVVVPAGFPAEWIAGASVEALDDDPPLSADELDASDGVVTTCQVAVAGTGTIVLDAGPGQGRRALSLVPDYHLVVVRAEQVVPGVPEALTRLEPARPQTWISGPSATSDIELNRVEGVHGPRTLDVVLVSRKT